MAGNGRKNVRIQFKFYNTLIMENNPNSPQAITLFIFSLVNKLKTVLLPEFLFLNVLLTTKGGEF